MMIPGGLKNVLDWLSRPLHQGDDWRNTALAGKKAAVSAVAGNSGGKYVLEQLEQLLSFTMADVMTEDAAAIAFSAETLKTGNILDTPGAKEAVTKEADAFLNFIERS
jgi:NAD(P)H-dependent FMN reductase